MASAILAWLQFSRLERLRRLRLGAVNHADHDNAGRLDIHDQFELLALGLIVSLACGLLTAGLRVGTVSIRFIGWLAWQRWMPSRMGPYSNSPRAGAFGGGSPPSKAWN